MLVGHCAHALAVARALGTFVCGLRHVGAVVVGMLVLRGLTESGSSVASDDSESLPSDSESLDSGGSLDSDSVDWPVSLDWESDSLEWSVSLDSVSDSVEVDSDSGRLDSLVSLDAVELFVAEESVVGRTLVVHRRATRQRQGRAAAEQPGDGDGEHS